SLPAISRSNHDSSSSCSLPFIRHIGLLNGSRLAEFSIKMWVITRFTQTYTSDELDASLLLLPLFDFLTADDPRIVATVDAIERKLMPDGLVLRYRGDVRAAIYANVTTSRRKARF
ncbi:hypothetical protein SB861_53335, partial [Paraburkholderia sp. SIMBA_049]